MILQEKDLIIKRTKNWITDVVVACNFCPFAGREFKRGSIHYEVLQKADERTVMEAVQKSLLQLDENIKIETSLLILSDCFTDFIDYLNLLDKAQALLTKYKYEGVYQLASFHPEYLFEDTKDDEPANYTNRSPYPMLHFLREESVSKAIDSYPDIENVSKQNIAFAHEKGLAFMQQLLNNC